MFGAKLPIRARCTKMSARADEMNGEVFKIVFDKIMEHLNDDDTIGATSLAIEIIRELNEAGYAIEKGS